MPFRCLDCNRFSLEREGFETRVAPTGEEGLTISLDPRLRINRSGFVRSAVRLPAGSTSLDLPSEYPPF